MDKFWELMEQSVIVQGLVTLVFVITACVVMVQGKPVPELLQAALMLILGWYFGSKTQQVASVAARKVKDGRDASRSGDSSDDTS
jgi:uncharacterized membrane protein